MTKHRRSSKAKKEIAHSSSSIKKSTPRHDDATNRDFENISIEAGFYVWSNPFPSFGGVVEDRGGSYRNAKNYFQLPFNPKLKKRARALRQARNLPEVIFWNQVKNKQFKGYDIDRQKIIGNYIVDFYCSNCQVVIEVDGSSHNDKVEYDAERDRYLMSLGLTVIHISAKEVFQELGDVMEMLHNHPALSGTPPKEGETTPPYRAPLQRRGIV